MKTTKINNSDIKVMQALRAGPLDSSEMHERFPSVPNMSSLLKRGWVVNGKFGYQLTEAGKAACPTRRQTERVQDLPPLPIKPARPIKPKAATISLHAAPTIKGRDPSMKLPSKSNEIREIITKTPGIHLDALISKATNNSTDQDAIKKTTDLIDYVVRQGGFTKKNDELMSTTGEITSRKRYFTNEAYAQFKASPLTPLFPPVQPATEPPANVSAAAAITQIAALELTQPEKPAPDAQEAIGTITMSLEKSALQTQEGGDHYKRMKIQPVEYIMANNLSFVEGSIIKYVSRWKNKNGIQDLKKARHFLDILIEQESA
jgi:hypothetical protein